MKDKYNISLLVVIGIVSLLRTLIPDEGFKTFIEELFKVPYDPILSFIFSFVLTYILILVLRVLVCIHVLLEFIIYKIHKL